MREADAEKKRKREKQQASQKTNVKSKSRKKLKLQPDHVMGEENRPTSSDDEEDDAVFSVDDDDESDYEHEHTLEDIELPDANALKENDFVLIKFATKNTVVMYVG